MSSSDWQLLPFSEAVVINPTVRLQRGEVYPFVDMNAVDTSRPNVHLSEERAFAGGESRFENGDTLFARITPCLENGKIARFKAIDGDERPAHGSTEFIVMRGRKNVSVSDFVFYLARSPHVRSFAISQMTGSSGRQRVPTDCFEKLSIALPSPDEQCVIASVLGALDEKIEQNLRAAQVLERLARAIFRAWFVDFEPVKAKAAGGTAFPSMPQPVFDALPTRFADSDIGPVPEGWESGRLNDLIEIHDSRRIPLSRRQREKRPGPYPYYGAAGIVDYVNEFLFDGTFVLVGEDGTVVGDGDRPMLQYVWGQFWVNNHAHVLTGTNGYTTEHLRVLLDHVNIRPFVTGAVQPKLNQGNLKSVPVIRAPRPVVEEFGSAIAPAFQLLRQIEGESRKLAKMRDYLLPKLLSGEVRIDHADAALAEGV